MNRTVFVGASPNGKYLVTVSSMVGSKRRHSPSITYSESKLPKALIDLGVDREQANHAWAEVKKHGSCTFEVSS